MAVRSKASITFRVTTSAHVDMSGHRHVACTASDGTRLADGCSCRPPPSQFATEMPEEGRAPIVLPPGEAVRGGASITLRITPSSHVDMSCYRHVVYIAGRGNCATNGCSGRPIVIMVPGGGVGSSRPLARSGADDRAVGLSTSVKWRSANSTPFRAERAEVLTRRRGDAEVSRLPHPAARTGTAFPIVRRWSGARRVGIAPFARIAKKWGPGSSPGRRSRESLVQKHRYPFRQCRSAELPTIAGRTSRSSCGALRHDDGYR